jgi:hypothetical protein
MARCGVRRHLPEALAEPQKPRSDVKMRRGNDPLISFPIVANVASAVGRSHLPLEMADNYHDNSTAGFHGVDAVAQLKHRPRGRAVPHQGVVSTASTPWLN